MQKWSPPPYWATRHNRGFLFKAQYNSVCFACCQDFYLSDFCGSAFLVHSISFIRILLKHIVRIRWTVNGALTWLLFCVFRWTDHHGWLGCKHQHEISQLKQDSAKGVRPPVSNIGRVVMKATQTVIWIWGIRATPFGISHRVLLWIWIVNCGRRQTATSAFLSFFL